MNFDFMNHALHALDDGIGRQPRNLRTYPSVPQADDSPASADTANKSLSHGQKDVHHAGLGSVEAGPIPRYWTVRFRYGGSALWDYTHVIACDPFKAAMVASKRKPSITETEVVREIQRDEYEHLTRGSP